MGICIRSWALWFLGYPKAALASAQDAVKRAREIGQAGSLMQALDISVSPLILCGDYLAAKTQLDELTALAEEKAPVLEGGGDDAPRLRVCPDRQSLERSRNDNHGIDRVSVNGSNNTGAGTHITFSGCLCRHRPFRRCLALHRRRDDGSGKGQRKVV